MRTPLAVGLGQALEPELDAAVVTRPLERRLFGVTAMVHLDPVELILDAAVTPGRRRGGGARLGFAAGVRAGAERRPARASALYSWNARMIDSWSISVRSSSRAGSLRRGDRAPPHLPAAGRVGHVGAEGWIDEVRRLDRADRLLPDHQVDNERCFVLADRQFLAGGLVRSRGLDSAGRRRNSALGPVARRGICRPGTTGLDRETRMVNRPGEGADQVGGEAAQVVEQNRVLLVQFRVEQQPALLRQDARVLTGEAAGETREIAVHDWPPLGGEADVDVDPGRDELPQLGPQVGDPERLP